MIKVKLICVPYAGGASYSYLPWNRYLLDEVEMVPVELSGRAKRYWDLEYYSLKEAAEDVFSILKKCINKEENYILFGHSMGSWIVYELAKIIVREKFNLPKQIIFSGNCPPYYPFEKKNISNLPDNQFITEIIKYGGVDRNILENKEYGEYFLRILRRDYRIIENYKCNTNDLQIDCNITVFSGTNDIFSEESLLSWKKCGTKKFYVHMFCGNHFFINSNKKEVTSVVNKIVLDIIENVN